MDRFQERLDQASKALAALKELAVLHRPSVVQRDALLLRSRIPAHAHLLEAWLRGLKRT